MKYIGYYIYLLHEKYGGAEDRAIEFERKFNEYCAENGVDIRIKRIMTDEDLELVEAVIIYGAHYKNHAIVKYLKDRYKVKIILSSVFVKNGPSLLYKLLSKINKPKTTQRMIYEIMNDSDYIFTSTAFEKEMLRKIFGVENAKIDILPNLIDDKYILSKIDDNLKLPIDNKTISKSYVCVGRIEPIKNQLILENIGENIIFIGNYNNEFEEYYNKFRVMVNKNKEFTHIARVQKDVLFNIVNKSKGLIMPSLFETTGRVALEAAVLNKPLILSNIDTIKEYLDEYNKVRYFNPRDKKELRKAVVELNNLNDDVTEDLDFMFCYSRGIKIYVNYLKNILNDNGE
ncbi:glycosyltransferase [Enterococcus gallinarum]|uniref:glycosyltransferase n=1 Tax=Enterococcus gallinarum TaxID=1353 RepID=UPI0035C9CDE3